MNVQTVLITGGASGIGLAMVRKFAAEGNHVFFIDTNHLEGTKLQFEAHEKGHQVKFLEGSIASFAEVEQLIHQIPEKIHVLINNAGISHIGKVETTSEDDFDRLFQVNVKGMFNCIKAALPKLKENGGGSILNMCSVAATIGIPDRFAYSMTKGAALSMTLSVARDYVQDGIRCNCLSPGRVHTPFVDGFLAKNYPGQEKEMYDKLAATQPIGRMGTPEEIAELAYFISSEAGSFITGANFNIDGGFMGLKM
ncbi:NAD(P)-dependent dehydrogenase, short-chain alcohol dehydrogenase family [Algoriphagus alkaliphilus]|uniref:NAD(P)-dependent dehydrogenase, short-chain alcohol dehydrogenase family n=1 Tax=Algoriphagus alkaliphilus TaxID=279824 RepID=A0A1G5X9E3_9BACT|nr:SDR family oxidoreductase [Algoriphagus alkaliphilus]SDA66546.1 NAD(P)-dependent dehydrogenase, short-chain alcohol dehydrogenase family [Algoriphagus alkaliphilus]